MKWDAVVSYLDSSFGGSDKYEIYHTTTCPKHRSQTGYGSKIGTYYMVRLGGRVYRVYAICWSNGASHYILVRGARYFLREFDITKETRP